MNLFEQIMSPFIFIIKQILLFSYELTGNYGVSIILLSFAISLLLLPVFIYIEKSKKKDDVIKNKMKPLIDEIKRVYKGQERYYYTKTINRQHNYNSLKALIPILSLLLQIPFFIAAYQFLENFEPLKEVSFGFISDLSQPDSFLGVINILPILMTLVNILTAYFYTRNGNKTELKQMLILAGAFLVLLFNLPAGLVLYWTMNNVFSFFRLFITNPEVFKQQKKSYSFTNFKISYLNQVSKLKIIFTVILAVLLFIQFRWAFEYNFNDIYARIGISIAISIVFTAIIGVILALFKPINVKIKPKVFYSLIFLSVYFYLASLYYYGGEDISLGILAIIILIPTQILGFLYVKKLVRENLVYNLTIFSFVLLITYQIILFITYISGNEIAINLAKISISIKAEYLSDIVAPGVVFLVINLVYFLKYNTINISTSKSNFWIFFLSISYISGLLFYWNPLTVYSSFPESFDFAAIDILKSNFALLFFTILISSVIFFLLSRKGKRLFIITLLTLSIISFINSSIIPVNLGTLQMHRFSDINNLSMSNIYYILESLFILFSVFFIILILHKKNFKKIIFALILLNIVTISQSVFSNIKPNNTHSNNKSASSYLLTENTSNKNKNIKDGFISFSQEKENVVVIVLDMLQGWYLKKMLSDNPELKQDFNGFTWYPNTISITNYTSSSAPSILAGFDYTPDKLNNDKLHTLQEKITNTNNILRDKAHNNNYNFTSTTIPYSKTDVSTYESNIPEWSDKWNFTKPILNIGDAKELGFSLLWQNAIFYSIPLFIKPQIYNEGNWLLTYMLSNDNNKLTKHYNQLRALPYISDVNSNKSSFIFYWTNASHFPWDIIDDKGNFVANVTPYENNLWVVSKIAIWLKWMKENNVYDNSKIIILSDHGIRDTEINDTIMIDNPFSPKISEKVPLKELLYFTPLMMVKDYNSKGNIKKDMRFLSNVDTYSIAFNENSPLKNDSAISRILEAYYVSWKTKPLEDKKIPIIKSYKVKDNVYDLKNWKILE